jgi:hypothetical protein
MDALDDLCPDLGRDLWHAEHLSPCGQRAGELVEKVFDAAGTPAQVVEQRRPHDPPAKPRPPGDGGIDVADADDTFGDEMDDLTEQSRREPVGNVARHFLPHVDRPLAEAV